MKSCLQNPVYLSLSSEKQLMDSGTEQEGCAGRRTREERDPSKEIVIAKKSGEIGVVEHGNVKRKKKKKKGSRKTWYFPRIGCLSIEKDERGNLDMEMVDANPTHLVIMVNGVIGSADDWKFAAKQFLKKYPQDVLVHCSKANCNMLTFDGVDVMGERLAEEVISVIKRHPSVRKISFVSHSLGGLISRYAIAKLYESKELSGENGHCKVEGSENSGVEDKCKGRIAGLEPLNFITYATPHLGSRWHRQVPVFCGFNTLEKAGACIFWFLGRTGKHLFLTDSESGKPPLLFQMVRDTEDLKFMSALQSFKRRVAYANAHFDYLVGWSTSSLRRLNELPKRRQLSRDYRYPHIINVERPYATSPHHDVLETQVVEGNTINMEEEMIRSLKKLSWERVDVSFSGSLQRFMAHSTIQVKTYCINSEGADVIQHMLDNFALY